MRHSKTWLGAWLVGAAVVGALPFACASVDNTGGLGDCDAPDGGACPAAGASGVGGTSGVAGTGGGGAGGGPLMGQGGGGAGGAPPCTDDETGDGACVSGEGGGSLCVGGVCTKATGECDAKLLVVVEHGRKVDDAQLAGACHFRSLEAARSALATAERLALYADEASSTAPLAFTNAASLEGRHSDPSKAVAVTLPQAAGTPLVKFAQGGTLKGVELNGGGVTAAVRAEAGALAVSGPTTLTNASLALELVGSATATVTGTETAPVRLSGNKRGVFVPAAATLSMQGDGKAESLVVEGTSGGGAAILFEAAGTSPCSTLGKVTFRDNTGSSGTDGTGAIEVRRGRQVVIDGCTFVHNRQSVTLSGSGGSGGSSADAFLGVQLQNNVFTDALPLEPTNTGSVLCGSTLGSSDTQLFLRAGNVFPEAAATFHDPWPEPLQAECADLPAKSDFGCDGGQVFGHSLSNMARSCQTDTCQCTGGTFQCGGT